MSHNTVIKGVRIMNLDAQSVITAFIYNLLNRTIRKQFASSGDTLTHTFIYDSLDATNVWKGAMMAACINDSNAVFYHYDNLDWLTAFTVAKTDGTLTDPHTMSFANNGNILSNSHVGTYSYGNNRPHAVVGITLDSAYAHAISAAQCDVHYNLFNQPDTITEGQWQLILYYGPDLTRWKTVLKKNGNVVETHWYVGDSYEKATNNVGSSVHNNIVSGEENAKVICQQGYGTNTYYYVHPDILGSWSVISRQGKRLTRSIHFDPWGNPRKFSNWTLVDSTTLTGFSMPARGFTGHEHLQRFNIINMKGRLYDPVIGRFFSPDNFVQAPGFTQSYNRYSYCLNNPLQYTDPSGEFWHLIVGAAIGGFLNVVLNANNIDNCWQGLAYFGIGAVAGALSAGVGAGISTAFAGGSFSAGFTGITAGVSATGFLSGSASSAASGFIGGFITGSGNSWISGNSFSKGLINGITQGGIGLFVGSLTGGIIGGIDALYKGTNFWTGTASFDLSDNYGAIGKPIGEKTVTGKYVGKFEGVNLYEANIPEGSAATLPGRGIILSKGQYSIYSSSLYTKQLLLHEFGHILQARKVGMVAYYSIIAKESFISASFDGINGWSHDLFWTETWANYLSQNYFGANSLINSWPSQNISWFNYLRLLSANIIIP